MPRLLKLSAALATLGLAACVTVPDGPSRAAMPGRTKSFEAFQVDDATCRDYAFNQIGGASASQNANNSAVASTVVGTVLGAAAGAALGGNSSAAGVGAGFGALTGAAVGTGTSQSSYYGTQRRYDAAYHQCMYAKGNKVPMVGNYQQRQVQYDSSSSYPPPANYPPPATYPQASSNGVYPPANLPPSAYPPPNAPPPR
jgi:uncharacterized protein YcfJ